MPLSDNEKYPPPQSFSFGPEKNKAFPPNMVTLDTKDYSKEDLTTVTDEHYPLIIKFETAGEAGNTRSKLYTYYTLKMEGNKCEAKVVKQKLEFKNKAYLLDDIYGITHPEQNNDSNQDSKDCSICLVNKLNTVVLPCKHICLCVDCAKNLRFRNNQRCPLCRKIVDTFLILKKTSKKNPEYRYDETE